MLFHPKKRKSKEKLHPMSVGIPVKKEREKERKNQEKKERTREPGKEPPCFHWFSA